MFNPRLSAIGPFFLLLPLLSCLGSRDHEAAPGEEPQMFQEAESYERFMGRWSRPLAPQLIQFAGVQDGNRVLDIGTGSGQLASALLESHALASVIGIDPSTSYVEHASSVIGDPRATFEVGDAQAMRFDDGVFDRSLSLLVVNFIPDAPSAVSEMRRVTRSGGTVAAAVWDYAEGMEMLRIFWDEAVALDPAAEPRDEKHMPHCTPDELARLWENAGLLDVETEDLYVEQRFESFADYWEPFLLGTGPAGVYAASLEANAVAELEERVRARLLGAGPDREFVLGSRAWAVKGSVP